MKSRYEFGTPKLDTAAIEGRKDYPHDARNAKWYVPVMRYTGIEVKELHPSVCPHFSTEHDAHAARALAVMNR